MEKKYDLNNNLFLEDIEIMVNNYETRENIDLINLSDWNPSNEFIQKIAFQLPHSFVQNSMSYIFSSDLSCDFKIRTLKKLGYEKIDKVDISFFDTGSLSILNILHLLFLMNIKDMLVITPSYFSVKPICDGYSIKCHYIELIKENAIYTLPKHFEEIARKYKCVWITNPIYCTGTYYNSEFIESLNRIIAENNLFLIIDESLSEPQYLISSHLQNTGKIFTIVSPHKALCTNGMKFSAIIFPTQYSKIVDIWSDIFSGCLSISALTAIHHFLSNDYDTYLKCFNNIIENNRKIINTILENFKVKFDVGSKSYLMSVYFPNIPYNYFDMETNMVKFIDHTAAYFIPNSRNCFPQSLGLSFRLNLCRVSSKYLFTFERSLKYLHNLRI